ncbi:MAG TPA: fatty acid desaturase [Polyangiales bacterium]
MQRFEAPELDSRPVSAGEVLAIWSRHLLALVFPLNALVFVLSAPHPAWLAFAFTVPVWLAVRLDRKSDDELRQPLARMPAWPFDALLLVLVALQLGNVLLLVLALRGQPVLSFDVFMAVVVVGSSSGYSGIVVAHELIHRPKKRWQVLGRLLLATVVYEHFYTEHVRGHHVRVGTSEDPATARFGESFQQFYNRTVPAQWKSAWRLETARLGDVNMRWYDPRVLRSRVLHGMFVELSFVVLAFAWAGAAAGVAFVLQAAWASRSLEVVNYFEHWGLTRVTPRVLPSHSWDTSSRFTYYALTGLSRHADHHAFASRPYQLLRVWEESPKLPRGYLAMFPLVVMHNRRYQRLMTEELRRRQLGPFAVVAASPTAPEAA